VGGAECFAGGEVGLGWGVGRCATGDRSGVWGVPGGGVVPIS